jgi:hypothetical protein
VTITYWTPQQSGIPPWVPGDDGFLGAGADPGTASGGGLLIAGTAYLARLPLRAPALISNLWVCVTAAGAGASTGSFVWLVSGQTGAVLAQSADTGTQFTTGGWQKCPMTSPVAAPAGPPYPYAVILTNLATTQPTMLRMLTTVNDAPQNPANVSQLRWAQQPAFGTSVGPVTLTSNAGSAFSNIVLWT